MIGGLVLAILVFANLSAASALDSAVANSPDVAAANARVDEAASVLSSARGTIAPSIVGSYVQTPQGNPPGPNVTSRIANIGLQTNIADFVAYGPSVRRSMLELESSRDDALVVARIERVKAASLYFDALKAGAVLAAQTRALDLATAQLAAAKKRFAAGDGPRLDVVRADVGIAKASADLEGARGANDDALAALALETGTPLDALDATAEDANALPAGDLEPARAIERALLERAEVASAIAAQNAEAAARAVVVASALPGLTVGAGYASGSDSGVPVRAPTIDVALAFPIGSSDGSRIRAESAKIAAARAHVAGVRRNVALEVGSAARAVIVLARAAEASSRARAAAELELSVADLGYRNGASSSLDVRSAQTAYAQALVGEDSARYDLAKARAILAIETSR